MFGANLVREFIEKFKDRRILVYFDPDVDGLFSGYFVCELLHSLGLQYTYYVNSKRQHGFTLQPSSVKGFFVIAVDFDIHAELVSSLVQNDVALLSLDHHDVQDDFIYYKSNTTDAMGVVINNQYPFEAEEKRFLSGAGVVYESICDCYPEFKTDERDAIVGITLLSDVQPTEGVLARKYLNKTFSADTQRGYIGYLVKNTMESEYGFGVPKLDRNFIDFTFSPRVNSLLRFGRESEALNFILGKGLTTVNTRKLQKDYVKYLIGIADIKDYTNLRVVCCDVSKVAPEYRGVDMSSFIGTVCSRCKSDSGNCIAYVLDNGKVTRASFRGKYGDIHYRVAFKGYGLKAEGHPNAFGINELEPSEELWVALNDICFELEQDHPQTFKLVESTNLSMLMIQSGMNMAYENCYVRNIYRTYIKYTGQNFRLTVDRENYREFTVDGRSVKRFDKELNPSNAYILPMLEKGHVALYLQKTVF